MNYDRQLTISSAGSRKATHWPAQTIYWSELVERLRVAVRGTETLAEYLRLPKSKQDDLKDVGGFMAGTLAGYRRKASAVTGRDIITLDLDNIPAGGTADVLRRVDALGCAYAVYSTRKHEEAKPRLRVLVPLSRTATADEYEPLARKLAAIIGIEMCDPSTFEVHRLMYWPSCCADSQFISIHGDKPFLDVDGLLATYADWRNVAEWPQVPGAQQAHVRMAAKQGDPTAKQGVVGAFCRQYDIYRAMETFLPGVYVPTDDGSGRFTFIGGSTTGGAIVYDNGAFLFSHHATDPVGGRLVNAFDLVRLHKFGDQDDDAVPGTPTNRLPSFTSMCAFALQDAGVAALMNQERYEKAIQDFGNLPVGEEETANWISKLQVSATTGMPAKTTDNVLIILEHDPMLKGKLAFDEFANRGLVLGPLPWDGRSERRQWTDVDDAGLRHYLERTYGITGKERIFDAVALCAHKHTINDVRDWLTSLQWDGVKRLDTLLIDYLGAKDSVYTRAVSRKAIVAAVARAMTPGCKYDYMPILAGPQGLGKSTFLRLLGRRWYSDSLQTFEGKEASEMIQGVWINEIGELTGMSKSEANAVKQFLSRTEDIYREPFGRRTSNYPRRCVFFGTTNDSEFLKDRTGNRRFWPVDVGLQPPTKSVFTQLEDEVPQIYAEAFVYWQLGEPLYLSGQAEAEAKEQQEIHRESSAKEGVIREFVERRVPVGWEKRSLSERRMYWTGEFGRGDVETVERDRICAAEVWCECLGGDLKYMKRTDAIEINGILAMIPGWKRYGSSFRFGPYGQQKGFVKVSTFPVNLP
ncbi:virulence-associated E family protein [Brevibacillus agri]|uniref:virulence-associated E family protein n=2 Tax=Bacteria TaxID=2 RepID=UPI0018CF4112|nr:virulence-associated E family protein [Brevibacillus agri]MBG9567551.1 virulence-associated protein E [Brevibacillus agri]MBG9567606.1 virulence-associated protein E [Brevibacillus agri]MBY0054116.1 virulence-associated protein E [Brevibacillus agri]